MAHQETAEFTPLKIAVLTVSDTRTEENDTSGQALVESLQGEGHQLVAKKIVIDDIYQLRAAVSNWVVDPEVEVILVTGGTGFSGRDSTPEALTPLFDKAIEGFGELFRAISYEDIGTSTVQSRAVAGLANKTAIFCMPGSTNACRTAWDRIIKEQLDSRHKPCNFVALVTENRSLCESRD